jgi:hypothetical protein
MYSDTKGILSFEQFKNNLEELIDCKN